MIQMDLSQAAMAVGADVESLLTFSGVAIDSRKVTPGCLFAALPGERVDGHDFVPQAVEQGAVAVLTERSVDASVVQLRVDSVQLALGQLAARWRDELSPRVAGITGSNGKTTVKEMLASILRQNAAVLSTEGNYNNELGVPLTVFQMDRGHDFAVLEMGASKAGDIRYLAGIAKPDVGLVNNVGPAHLKGFGDERGVAHAKGEMFESLPASGFAVLNRDEPWFETWEEMVSCNNRLSFGFSEQADVRAVVDGSGYRVETPTGSFDLQTRFPGRHNVMNALAAAAMAQALDVPCAQIDAGLRAAQPVAGRLNRVVSEAGWTLIDDSYNANPASLYAAIQVLAEEQGETWLALGDMKELGADSNKMHTEMGAAAAALGIKRLFAIGPRCAAAVEAFGAGGIHFESRDELINALLADLHPGVTCLLKGSRSMGMDKVVDALMGSTGSMEKRHAG